MRLSGFKSLLFGAIALLFVGAFTGCENPLDPLDKSDKIQGLSYFDFSATWDRWDSDAEYDGVVISLDYYNEYGDSLSFHDKPHSVVIEFWSQVDTGEQDENGAIANSFWEQDVLLFSTTVEYSNSDDSIRIPIESYYQEVESQLEETLEATGFIVVRVFPPQEYPRQELVVAYPDMTFFKPETAETSPNP